MCNLEIREYAKKKDVKFWKIAERLGIADATFSRHLRHEFSEEKKNKIKVIIDELAEQGGN